MAEAIDTAYVEIRPDFTGFGRDVERGIRQSLRTVDTDVSIRANTRAGTGLAAVRGDIDRTTGSLRSLDRQSRTSAATLGLLGGAAARSGALLGAGVAGGVAAVGIAAASTVKASIDFESAFAGVRKTVDATEPQLQSIRQDFLDLSTEIPVTASALAAIGEAAGQLGVRTSAIDEFTETVANLAETTNLTADVAADSLARIANITQLPQEQFGNLGSAIVDLGNKLAATEAEIVAFGLRIAGAGKQVGLSEPEILAIGAALSSVGLEAEAGGTAISTTLIKIASAVSSGGKKLAAFASISGQSAEEFAESFRTKPAAALVTFIRGLDRIGDEGGNVFKALEDLGLGGIRVRDALLRSAGAGDLLARSLAIGTNAFRENTALAREAGIRYETTASRLSILRNEVTALQVSIGDKLGPAIGDGADAVGGLISDLRTNEQVIGTIRQAFENLGRILGPIFDVFRDNKDVIRDTFANAGEQIRRMTVLAKPVAIVFGVTLVAGFRAAFFALDKLNKAGEIFGEVFEGSVRLAIAAIDKFLGGISFLADALSFLPVIGDDFDGVADRINAAREDLRGFADELDGVSGKTVTATVKLDLPKQELFTFLGSLEAARGGVEKPGGRERPPAFGEPGFKPLPGKKEPADLGPPLADVPKTIQAAEQRLQDNLALAQAIDDSTANDRVALDALARFYDEQANNLKLNAALRRGFLVRAEQTRSEIRLLAQQEVTSAQDDAETRARAAIQAADATVANQRDDVAARRRLVDVLRQRVTIARQTGEGVAQAQSSLADAERDLANEIRTQRTERVDLRLEKAQAALQIAETTEKTLADDIAAQRRIVGAFRKKLEIARASHAGVQAAVAALRTAEDALKDTIKEQAQKRADERLDAIEDEKKLASFTEGKGDDEKALRAEERFWKKRIAALRKGTIERRKAKIELARTRKEIRDLDDDGDDARGGTTLADLFTENQRIASGAGFGGAPGGLRTGEINAEISADVQRRLDARITDPTASQRESQTQRLTDSNDRLIDAIDRLTTAVTSGNSTAGTGYSPEIDRQAAIVGSRYNAYAKAWRAQRAKAMTEESSNG